ncbi:MAG: hypothetical protein RIS86_680, partial [Planctomycetota bacterium]
GRAAAAFGRSAGKRGAPIAPAAATRGRGGATRLIQLQPIELPQFRQR